MSASVKVMREILIDGYGFSSSWQASSDTIRELYTELVSDER